MADAKLSALTELSAAPATDDLLVLDDISDTTQAASGTTKKLTVSNLLKSPTLGVTSGDTLTVNAGTWTLGSNYVATRAAGALAAGAVSLQTWTTTFTGDMGGTTQGRAFVLAAGGSGSNGMAAVEGLRTSVSLSTTAGATTQLKGVFNTLALTDAGTATNAQGFNSLIAITGAGGITAADNYLATAPSLTSTGAITTLTGFNSANLGHATLVTNAIGFNAANFTAAATLTAAFRSQMTSGSTKWGFYASGTADNAFAGPVRIGSVVAPAAGIELDVTGDVQISGNVGFYGTAAAARPSAYTQTYSTATRTHSNLTSATLTNANGSADTTIADVTASHSQTILNNNFRDLSDQVNALRVDLVNLKGVVNSLIDDGQTVGLLQ